jgi:glutathione S-transferase
MYRLYWDRGSANMAPHAVLREIGVPFELVRVDVGRGDNFDPAYLRLNPNHRVPTLIDGDRALYESAAIVLYLCEKHPEAGLMPLPGDPQRHLFLQWLVYCTNTVQEDLQHWWHGENYVHHAASQADLKAVAEQRLDRNFSQLDSALAQSGPYLLGERFSAADIYLVMLCRWTRRMARPALAYPHIKALIGLVTARPAWSAMMAAEGIDWNGPLA